MTEKSDSLASGDIHALLRKMAVPGVLSQILLLLYNMVDRIYLGRLNDGGMALLAVGLCLPVTYFFNAVAFLFGQGGAAVTYMRIYTLGAVAIMGYMGFLQFVISQGATRQAMYYVVGGAVLNVVLDPILIFACDMGVAGAAIATVLSQLLIAVLSIRFLASPQSRLRLRLKNMAPRRSLQKMIVSLGFSPFLMQITEAVLTVVTDASAQKYGGDDLGRRIGRGDLGILCAGVL